MEFGFQKKYALWRKIRKYEKVQRDSTTFGFVLYFFRNIWELLAQKYFHKTVKKICCGQKIVFSKFLPKTEVLLKESFAI